MVLSGLRARLNRCFSLRHERASAGGGASRKRGSSCGVPGPGACQYAYPLGLTRPNEEPVEPTDTEVAGSATPNRRINGSNAAHFSVAELIGGSKLSTTRRHSKSTPSDAENLPPFLGAAKASCPSLTAHLVRYNSHRQRSEALHEFVSHVLRSNPHVHEIHEGSPNLDEGGENTSKPAIERKRPPTDEVSALPKPCALADKYS